MKIPDIVSFHPYNARQLGSLVPADENIAGLRDRMKKYGRPDIPIWNTEVYYLREKKPGFDYLDEREVPPHLAACRFLTDVGEGLGQSIALNLSQIWKRVLTPNARYVKNYHQLIPSETMVAYNALARLFERSHAVKKIRFPEGAICYIYRKDGALIAAVWNYKKIKGLKADLSAFEVMDLFGNPEKPGEKPLADAPFYLTQGKLTDQEFIDMLSKLPLRLDRPVFPGELARLAGNKLFVMLINNSDKKQFGQAGVNGGLIADDPVRFTVEPRSSIVLQIPVSEGEKGKKTNLVLYHEKNLFRIPLNIVRNTLIDGSFKLENTSGKISFGKGMIRVEMNVSDPSEAKKSDSVKPWETDCVELFFDTEPLHLPYQFAQAYLPTTFRLFVTPRGQKKLHAIGKIDPEKCKLDLKQTPEGYSFTLEIPVQTKKYLGFGVQIDDFDGTRLRQIATGKDMFDHRCNFGIAEAK